MASDDLPTPEQFAAYVEARGWVRAADVPGSVFNYWEHDGHDMLIGYPLDVRYRRGALSNLEILGIVEGRPTPAEQVRRDMVGPRSRLIYWDSESCSMCGDGVVVRTHAPQDGGAPSVCDGDPTECLGCGHRGSVSCCSETPAYLDDDDDCGGACCMAVRDE